MWNKGLFLFIGFILFPSQLMAQLVSQPGSDLLDSGYHWVHQNSYNYFHNTFQNRTRIISPVLNGKDYNPSQVILSEGTLFYNSEDWTRGDIIYDGYEYKNVLLKYDLFQDVLISPYEKFDKIYQFIPELLGKFQIFGKTFLQFMAQPTVDSLYFGLKTGIYQELYSGKTKIWAKRIKRIDRNLVSGKIEFVPVSENRYFVFRKDRFLEFSNINSLLKVLEPFKSPLQKYLVANKINYKKDPESAMVLLAKELDSIDH